MRNRNFSIAMDHAHGETFAAIAEKNDISSGRAHQVWESMLHRLALGQVKHPTAQQLLDAMNKIQRMHNPDHPDTPEGFYNQLNDEEKESMNKMWERRRASGYR